MVTEQTNTASYADVAAFLHGIADTLGDIDPNGLAELWVQVNIQPRAHGDEAKQVRTVDAVGLAVLGHAGSAHELTTAGTWHHSVDGDCGPVNVAAYTRVRSPEQRDAEAQLVELRAELDRVRRESGAGDEWPVAASLAEAALTPDSVTR